MPTPAPLPEPAGSVLPPEPAGSLLPREPAGSALPPEPAGSNDDAEADVAAVARLLGRRPQGDFEVVVRDAAGGPVVIRNAPLLHDGTPMPTRHWLVGATERLLVSRLEAAGGVARAEAEVPADEVAAAHRRAAQERDAAMPPGWNGLRPSGGVGGTRTGVKCLHCHYADHLAGTGDPVGRWVARRLGAQGDHSGGGASATS